MSLSSPIAASRLLAVAPSDLLAPTTNAPSAQNMKEVSQYDGNLKTLDGKSKALNQVTSELAGK
jgi:hypothetical protein